MADTPDFTPVLDAIQGGTPEANIKAATLINKKIEDDKQGHINTQTQWAPFLINLVTGNLGSAYNSWNGGPTRQVEAYGPGGDKYIKEYNSRGHTGRVFDANGNELNADKIKTLDQQGLISREDITAQSTGAFQAGVSNATALASAERNPVLLAYQKAQGAALSSAGMANMHQERALLAKDAKWMDTVQQLDAKKRAELFKVISSQTQASQGKTTESGTTQGASAGGQGGTSKGTTAGMGAQVGATGIGQGQGAGMAGPGISGNIGGTGGSFANMQTMGSAGATSGAGTSQSTGNQQQANFRSQIEGILQSKLGDKEFADMQRYVQLTNNINAAAAKRSTEEYVPGVVPVAQQDYLLSGRRNSALADVQGMQNEAMTAAWNKFLAQKIHQAGGQVPNVALISDEFLQTPVAQGIRNRFGAYMDEIKTGKKHEPQEGAIYVDNQNNPVIIRNGKQEKLNVR